MMVLQERILSINCVECNKKLPGLFPGRNIVSSPCCISCCIVLFSCKKYYAVIELQIAENPCFMRKVMSVHNVLYIEEIPINRFDSGLRQSKALDFSRAFSICVVIRVA